MTLKRIFLLDGKKQEVDRNWIFLVYQDRWMRFFSMILDRLIWLLSINFWYKHSKLVITVQEKMYPDSYENLRLKEQVVQPG
jgi:hypothetical protein